MQLKISKFGFDTTLATIGGKSEEEKATKTMRRITLATVEKYRLRVFSTGGLVGYSLPERSYVGP